MRDATSQPPAVKPTLVEPRGYSRRRRRPIAECGRCSAIIPFMSSSLIFGESGLYCRMLCMMAKSQPEETSELGQTAVGKLTGHGVLKPDRRTTSRRKLSQIQSDHQECRFSVDRLRIASRRFRPTWRILALDAAENQIGQTGWRRGGIHSRLHKN